MHAWCIFIEFLIFIGLVSRQIVAVRPSTGSDLTVIKSDPNQANDAISRQGTDSSTTTETSNNIMAASSSQDILIVFSDVDGTLVHYPTNIDEHSDCIQLPPSSTGMQGIISAKTLHYCQQIRQTNRKFVLISGMRTTTLWKRLPYLPRADAYCSEAGGRIFYPTTDLVGYHGPLFVPQPYDGCKPSELQPFGLIEDLHWRTMMEQTCGRDGFVGMELDATTTMDPIIVSKRTSSLWDFAQKLIANGLVIDTEGYSTCFRVNRKQQSKPRAFDALEVAEVPKNLATSTNLGCIDFYPMNSGKKRCCIYLAQKLCNRKDASTLASSAICLCDDDNDLEMAMACHHAFVPSVSSESMARAIKDNPTKLTLTDGMDGITEGTAATERALELILQQL